MKSDTGFDVAVLPEIFRPRSGAPLVRIGRDGDGGYLIDQRNLAHTDHLIGIGINDDWSFEAQFLAQCDVRMFAYDASVSGWDFFIAFYTKLALFEPINAWNALKLLVGYRRFFNTTTRIHRQENVGRGSGAKDVSLETVLARDVGTPPQRIFFKIDIEGGEYELFDSLIACAERIEGLTIELHDVDRNMVRIRAFIEAFPLELCHVHANNCGVVLDDRTPTVIECSFTRQPTYVSDDVELPHELDFANWPARPELAIRFGDAGDTRIP